MSSYTVCADAHQPLQVQWCDWDPNLSDVGAGQLEAVEPPGLDVAKVTGITAAVITQLVRLAGLTHEVS